MASFHFSETGERFEVEDGTRLTDLEKRERLPVPLGCYAGHCAACMMKVTVGEENLEAPNVFERYTLTEEEFAQGIRLGCQLTIVSGEVTLAPY